MLVLGFSHLCGRAQRWRWCGWRRRTKAREARARAVEERKGAVVKAEEAGRAVAREVAKEEGTTAREMVVARAAAREAVASAREVHGSQRMAARAARERVARVYTSQSVPYIRLGGDVFVWAAARS